MTVVLNHLVVPASAKQASAAFLADLLGLRVEPPAGEFAPDDRESGAATAGTPNANNAISERRRTAAGVR